MTRFHQFYVAFILLTCSTSTSGVSAQQLPEGQAVDPASMIEVAPHELSDVTLQRRIEEIFSQIDAPVNVDVSVQQGVVTLSGQINEARAHKALGLANRMEGVVTVKDDIERTLDLEGNVTRYSTSFPRR